MRAALHDVVTFTRGQETLEGTIVFVHGEGTSNEAYLVEVEEDVLTVHPDQITKITHKADEEEMGTNEA
jgi:hypothetical protein